MMKILFAPIQLLRHLPIRKILPLLLGVIASIAILFLWYQLSINERTHIEELTYAEATKIERNLSAELTTCIRALQRMAKRWENSNGTPRKIWESDAKAYLHDFYGYKAIEYVDSSYHVRWVVPLAGNEAVVNLDLSQEPRRKITLKIAQELREALVTRTISLAQGGKGFFVCVPLFVGDRFDGFIVGVFQYPNIFEGILTSEKNYEIKITDGNTLIYSQGSLSKSNIKATASVKAYGVSWQIEVRPNFILLDQHELLLPKVVLIGGLTLAWLLVLVLYLIILSYRRIRQFKAANQQLNLEVAQKEKFEMALAISQSRFAGILDIASDAIISVDGNQTITLFNQGAEKIFGYQNQEILGKSLSILLPERLAQRHSQHIQNYGQTPGETRQMGERGEIFGRRKDGTEFPAEASISKLNLNGEVIFTVFLRDITAKKVAQKALQESEATKQAIIDAIPDLLIRMRSDGTCIDMIASNEFTLVKSDLVYQGMNLYEILPQPLAEKRKLYTQKALELGITQIYEEEILIKEKQYYEEVRIVPLMSDEVLIMVRDITARKQAETELNQQKEMFQAIVNHIPVMIAMFNAQGKVEFINRELETTLGWSLETWQEQDILRKCYPDPVDYQAVVEHLVSANGKWKDIRALTATGKEIETSWTNVQLSNGYFLGIGQDISDRKQIEIELRQAMEAAEAANLAKSIFLANMSHELRTPLNVIIGFTQVMRRDASLTSTQREDLDTIRRSGDHLLNLINDILDLSKIESGHYHLEETAFDLIAMLHSLRSMLSERISSKKLQLTFDISPEVPQFIIADQQKLRQILLNLLTNAIKFTSQGSITLQLITQNSQGVENREADATTPFFRNFVQLHFQVSDTGVGIAAEELETIFDAFVQAKAGRNSNNGTGLGLTISRKLLQLMGGEISVSSILGTGSTFTFSLPVTVTNSVNLEPEYQEFSVIGLVPNQSQRRILVVDDQKENRLLLVKLLVNLGFEVREAANGKEAVQIWQEWQPDLTWMDIRMPILDGYEATKQIRAMESETTSIIIALTAQASQSDRTLALAAGCNDYISKPFREETLYLKMKEFLGLEYIYAKPKSTATEQLESLAALENSDSWDECVTQLSSMSEEWFTQIKNAALCGDDELVAQLIAQLPPTLSQLAIYLTKLMDNYQFEEILKLISTDKLEEGINSAEN